MTLSRRASFVTVTTTLLVALSGCGSSATSPSGTPTPPPRALAIVPDAVTGNLLTEAVDSETGALHLISSATALKSVRFAADPLGRFVYLGVGYDLVTCTLDRSNGLLTERARVPIDPADSHQLSVASFSASLSQVHVGR